MAAPWQTIATISTPEGPLELRRRQNDWLMVIGGRVLMNSFSRTSEEALARLAVEHAGSPPQRVLVSGLGMGFTLRALLDRVAPKAHVVVVEINQAVVEWCRGPLAEATSSAITDPRVRVEVADVSKVIAAAKPGSYDLILLDLYEGPNPTTQRGDDPFYGPGALARTHKALAPNGVFGVWSEDPDPAFARRLEAAQFAVTRKTIGGGGRAHTVYFGVRKEPRARRAG